MDFVSLLESITVPFFGMIGLQPNRRGLGWTKLNMLYHIQYNYLYIMFNLVQPSPRLFGWNPINSSEEEG